MEEFIMLDERILKELKQLEEVAYRQNNKINLSIILISMKCDTDELSEIIEYYHNEN